MSTRQRLPFLESAGSIPESAFPVFDESDSTDLESPLGRKVPEIRHGYSTERENSAIRRPKEVRIRTATKEEDRSSFWTVHVQDRKEQKKKLLHRGSDTIQDEGKKGST